VLHDPSDLCWGEISNASTIILNYSIALENTYLSLGPTRILTRQTQKEACGAHELEGIESNVQVHMYAHACSDVAQKLAHRYVD
jgi:hypothetical protein